MIVAPAVQTPVPPPPFASLAVPSYQQLVSRRYSTGDGLPAGEVSWIGFAGDRVWARIGAKAFTLDGDRWRAPAVGEVAPTAAPPATQARFPGVVLSAARAASGAELAMTTEGPYRSADGKVEKFGVPAFYKAHQPIPSIDARIRGFTADNANHVWIATDAGAFLTDGGTWWQPYTRAEGMPYEDVTSIAVAPNGDVWGGTPEGAWRLRAGDWRYFWGKRWMPGNRVTTIAFGPDGAVWLGTDAGVARVSEITTTLAKKAEHYEQITEARHVRSGYVTGCGLKTPGDPNGGVLPEASDNDGLWTAVHLAAEAFRFGATRDRTARDRAHRGLQAILDLVRKSGYPGFPARAIIRKGEETSGYNPTETVRIAGETNPIWYQSPTHPDLLCKGDTSSDELDGHYFAWYVYSELVATPAERKEIAEVARAVTDNLLRNNLTLVGHTGKRTLWGMFGPEAMNDDPRWYEERGLNSLELLCYLRVAAHLTGDAKYLAKYDEMIAKHHYLLNTMEYRRHIPWNKLNHSDDELAFCVYYPLLMLEKAPDRRAVLLQSLSNCWDGLQHENRSFYNVAFGALTGRSCRIEDAVATLQDWPWELVEWAIRNSHRHDVRLRADLGLTSTQTDRALRASERPIGKWNSNPFDADGGGTGGSEEDGGAWLLAYWMARHHGLISEATPAK